jgi:hypothetical protein
MPVERHFVRFGSLSDCFNPDCSDAMPIKEADATDNIRSRGEIPLSFLILALFSARLMTFPLDKGVTGQ